MMIMMIKTYRFSSLLLIVSAFLFQTFSPMTTNQVSQRNAQKCYSELHKAARTGNIAAVEVLLINYAYINGQDEAGWTPLHWAAQNNHKKIIELLLQKGASIDIKDNHGRTPLHLAVSSNRVAAVKSLLSKGANIHTQNNTNDTLFSTSRVLGYTEVEALINHSRRNFDNTALRGYFP